MTDLIEPDFIAQTAEAKTAEERRAWWEARAQEDEIQGARWHRYSIHDETGTILIESWKRKPRDEGPVRWMFAA